MGRLYLRLDPSGYKYPSERGYDWEISGRQLYTMFLPDARAKYDHKVMTNFYNPPGSEYLMCRPRQFYPLWYKSPRMQYHVLKKNLWTFSSSVTTEEFEWFTREPNSTSFAHNKGLQVTRIAAGGLLDNTNYTALQNATARSGNDVNLPTGVKTIAFCGLAPTGHSLATGEPHVHPHVEFSIPPGPHNYFLFGFSNLAFLISAGMIYVLRSPNNDRQSWELVTFRNLFQATGGSFAQTVIDPDTGMDASGLQPNTRWESVTVLPVEDTAYVVTRNIAFPIQLRDSLTGPQISIFPTGAPWVAGAPGSRPSWQMQLVGYEAATTDDIPGEYTMFTTGANFKPSVAQQVWASRNIWEFQGVSSTSTTLGNGDTQVDSPTSGQRIVYGIRTKSGGAWASDGTNFEGRVHLAFTPSDAMGGTTTAYLSPSIRNFQLKFPVKLTSRTATPLTLDDTQWSKLRVEAGLDPEGKQVEFHLTTRGQADFEAAGFADRYYYPVHVLEDVDGDGDPTTVRARGWVFDPDHHQLKSGVDGSTGIHGYRLAGRGILARADNEWPYLPQLVDPASSGHLEHTTAIRETLKQCGIDVTDTVFVGIATDPNAGTQTARLPGTSPAGVGVAGTATDSPWAPAYGESRLTYMVRVAQEWRGWVLYEQFSGKIWYHPDLNYILQLGQKYSVAATIYASHEAATSAGYPGQCWVEPPQRRGMKPRGNYILITGEDAEDGEGRHVIDADLGSIGVSAAENFVGEPLVITRTPRFAIDEAAKRQIARVCLRNNKLPEVDWIFDVQLPPWQIGAAGVDVGDVMTVQTRGDYRIMDLDWECGSRMHITRFAVQKLPSEGVAGSVGAYPGSGV